MVVMVTGAAGAQVFVQQASGHHGHAVARVRARYVQRHRVKAGEHPHVRNDSRVILTVAVAVRRNLVDDIDMESRAAVHHSLGVLGHLAVQLVVGGIVAVIYGVKIACTDAAAAAHTFAVVDARFAVFIKSNGSVRAVFHAHAAAPANAFVHVRLTRAMHVHLSCARTAAHADILDGAAEARALVPFEVGQRNEYIRIHHGAADMGLPDVFAAAHGHVHLIRPLQAVCNNDLAAGGKWRKPVFISRFDMVQRIFAAPHIQRVAVCQKRAAAQLFHGVRNGLCKIGPQVRKVARFAEMDFDSGIFILKIDLSDARFEDQPLEFLLQVRARQRTHVCKIYFRGFHSCSLTFSVQLCAVPHLRGAFLPLLS